MIIIVAEMLHIMFASTPQRDLLDQVRSPQRTIAKIHGCITEPNDLVLDRMSYFKARQLNHGFFQVMSALFTTHTVLS